MRQRRRDCDVRSRGDGGGVVSLRWQGKERAVELS